MNCEPRNSDSEFHSRFEVQANLQESCKNNDHRSVRNKSLRRRKRQARLETVRSSDDGSCRRITTLKPATQSYRSHRQMVHPTPYYRAFEARRISRDRIAHCIYYSPNCEKEH